MTTAVIASAGSGNRFNGGDGKALASVLGEPLFIYSVRIFDQIDEISNIIIVAREEDIIPMYNILADYDFSKPINIVSGGETRGESVKRALEFVPTERVLLHDAARPCVDIDTIINAMNAGENVCVVNKLHGTIHKTSSDLVEEVVDRSKLYEAQTPQIFNTDSLKAAYDNLGTEHTDDASLVAQNGEPVKLFIGRPDNIKITTQDDLCLAEAVLSRKG